MGELVVHEYGVGPDTVIVIHGGPAAAGDLAPLARELGQHWRVLEPYQRGHGEQPLTVSTHVRDLDELVRQRGVTERAVLVGHSWGAMLALAYAAAVPAGPRALVLVGCGTFSRRARAEFQLRFQARMTPADHGALAQIERTEVDPDRRLAAEGRVATRVFGHDVDGAVDLPTVDAVAHRETWSDMSRLIDSGVYPAAFEAITCPTLMIHGAVDPHPGSLTRDDLKAHMPRLDYVELSECGHSPWLERRARHAFFDALLPWISDQWTRPQ